MIIYIYSLADDDGLQTNEVVVDGSTSGGTKVILDRGPNGMITGIEIIDGARVTVSTPDEARGF